MPILARVYGIPPRDQPALTLQQFRDLQADYHRSREQEVT